MDAFEKSKSIPSVKTKLKSCDPVIKDYVRYLEKENAKLHRKLVKADVDKLTLKNRISALEKENKSFHIFFLGFIITNK